MTLKLCLEVARLTHFFPNAAAMMKTFITERNVRSEAGHAEADAVSTRR